MTLTHRHRRLIVLAAMLYAVVLVAASFEHHDLICHLKHPDHCTACSSNVLGSDPRTPAINDVVQLTDAGRGRSFHGPIAACEPVGAELARPVAHRNHELF